MLIFVSIEKGGKNTLPTKTERASASSLFASAAAAPAGSALAKYNPVTFLIHALQFTTLESTLKYFEKKVGSSFQNVLMPH